MATVLGKVDEFISTKEESTHCVERLEHFFVANDIASRRWQEESSASYCLSWERPPMLF